MPSAVTFVIALGPAGLATCYLSIVAFAVGVIWVFERASAAAKNPAVTAT
jgi:hypothetical protein